MAYRQCAKEKYKERKEEIPAAAPIIVEAPGDVETKDVNTSIGAPLQVVILKVCILNESEFLIDTQ